MSRKSKQPKETDGIRALLGAYTNLQRRIDNAEERLAFLEESLVSPSSSGFSGMSGGSRDRTSKQERDYIKKEELERKLGDMSAEENRLREEIEGLVELMENPDEQTVIEMRYFDRVSWRTISVALYGSEEDFETEEERYLKRTFRVHGRALQTLAKIYGREE